MNILITGGLGYIGSHLVTFLEKKHNIVIVDNLCNSKINTLYSLEKILKKKIIFYKEDIRNTKSIRNILKLNKINLVIHLASLKSVNESIFKKKEYFLNNLFGTKKLLKSMIKENVSKIIFSSTAAIYGDPVYLPIDEKHPVNILNPYAETKFLIEKFLNKISAKHKKFKIVNFRYFNPAGSHQSNLIGDNPKKPNNLFPSINYAIKKQKFFKIFGSDYDTKDGTAIRDFIHIDDLCDAHLKCVSNIDKIKGFNVMNLGSGKGYTILDIVKNYQKMTKVKYKFTKRRKGDVSKIFTSYKLAEKKLKWKPKKTLSQMCKSSFLHSKSN